MCACRFMEDLQAEVQEMEFMQFSKGMDTMRREDFADWLLHYTNEEDNTEYLENMRRRIPTGQVRGFTVVMTLYWHFQMETSTEARTFQLKVCLLVSVPLSFY